MADDERRSSFSPSPPSSWGDSPHIYPHSHHGTPAQEYPGFNFNAMQMPMEQTSFRTTMQHRAMPAQLQPQPLVMPMPQWPSQLSSQSYATAFQPTVFAQAVQPFQQPIAMGPVKTPVSASSSRSASGPRRTLTDADRKRMCEYVAEHPNEKQQTVGRVFGVERSTVSKVLRQKEKYLRQDEGRRSPVKRIKGRSPDIERALANWAIKQEKEGVSLTDDLIRNKARTFAATSPGPEAHQKLTTAWIEKFRRKNKLKRARSRKSSLAPDDSEGVSSTLSSSHTPSGTSPISEGAASSPQELHSAASQESLKNESPDSYADFHRLGIFHSQSATSLHSAFTDPAPSCFSPGALSPTSPLLFTPDSGTAPGEFVPPLTARPILPDSMSSNAQRPRSQTFPLLDTYMSSGSPDLQTPRYIPSTMLESPMEDFDDPMTGLGETVPVTQVLKQDRPTTISPGDTMISRAVTMLPPPLPHHIRETKAQPQPIVPTFEEAKKYAEGLMVYFAAESPGRLSFQESAALGSITDKFSSQSRVGN